MFDFRARSGLAEEVQGVSWYTAMGPNGHNGGVKVFGIGLNKTGTISLHEALTRLGFRGLHWGGPEVRLQIEAARDEGRHVVGLAVRARLADVPEGAGPRSLSRFILTTRPLAAWLTSRQNHVERNRARRTAGTYTGDFLDVDLAAWQSEYEDHHSRVHDYFRGRPDLL